MIDGIEYGIERQTNTDMGIRHVRIRVHLFCGMQGKISLTRQSFHFCLSDVQIEMPSTRFQAHGQQYHQLR